MAYKVADRVKEWTTYAGLAVAGVAAVVPELVPAAQWVHFWADAQLALGAAMVFMPQTAGAQAVENEALPLLQALAAKIPPEYATALHPLIAILAKVAVLPPIVSPPSPAPVPGVLVAPPNEPVVQQPPVPSPVVVQPAIPTQPVTQPADPAPASAVHLGV